MTIDIRTLRPPEWDALYGGLLRALGAVEPPEERELWDGITEADRTLGAWEGAEAVGSASAFSLRMTVPGGALVPTAGVSMVHVKTTHRRRGILRALMRRQLDAVREAGTEPLAALTASEPGIYGRFGYGMATRKLMATIDTSRVALSVPPGADALRLRIAEDPAAVREECEAVYARQVAARPGMLERAPLWDRIPLLDPEQERRGALPLACVLAEDPDGAVRGYARYFVRISWDAMGAPQGSVELRDMEALDPAAYGALWRHLFGIDLTATLQLHNRPVDDAWLHMVSDVRRCGPRWRDSLFLRLVDVGAALAARTYAAPVDAVLEVTDDFCPWNTGRWRLSGDTKGAACEPTRDAADLALPVGALGAAYLGGTSLTALAAAGLVEELRPGALPEAALAFGSPVAPWLPLSF